MFQDGEAAGIKGLKQECMWSFRGQQGHWHCWIRRGGVEGARRCVNEIGARSRRTLLISSLKFIYFFSVMEKLGKNDGVLRGKLKKEFNLGYDKFEMPGTYLNDSDE